MLLDPSETLQTALIVIVVLVAIVVVVPYLIGRGKR
jgi:hypothetical protein